MHNLKRILKYGWLNFSRNLSVSSATVGVMILMLLAVGFLIIGQATTQSLVSSIEQKVDISVYFIPKTSEQDILKVKSTLEKRGDVKSVEYISQNQAYDQFKERHKNDLILMQSLQELGENPLQATLNIKAFKTSQLAAIAASLGNPQYTPLIDKVNYQENEVVINRLLSINTGIERAGIVFSIILGLFVFLVTFNTIRLVIYSARDEISVMRLVGAGNGYIRGPFIITGALYGIFAAVISLVIMFGMIRIFAPHASAIFAEIDLVAYFKNSFFMIAGILFGVGVGLGMVSSFIATRKYLSI